MKPDDRHRIPLDRENWKWLADRARTAFPPCSVAKMANAMIARMRMDEAVEAIGGTICHSAEPTIGDAEKAFRRIPCDKEPPKPKKCK